MWDGRLSSQTGGPEYEGWNGEGLKAGVVGPCLKLLVWEVCFGIRDSGGEDECSFQSVLEYLRG
jgi:hypothetical protein